jgi:hypothetical protein
VIERARGVETADRAMCSRLDRSAVRSRRTVANEVAVGHTVKAHVHVGGKVIIETLLGRSFFNFALIALPIPSPLIQAATRLRRSAGCDRRVLASRLQFSRGT